MPTLEMKPLAGVRRSDIPAWVNARAKTDDNPEGLAPATLKKVYGFVASTSGRRSDPNPQVAPG